MEKHYDTDGINVYLMLTDTDYQVSYETKMLQNNCIPYVLPFNVMFIDGDAIPCYEVNGLTEFAVIEQTITITPVLILQLFQELVMVFHQLGRYLLSVNNLILVEDCIFYDIAQKCFGFIYLPGYQSGVREQMRRLLDQVICRMDHADRAGSDRVYDLYQKIMDANCDLEKLVDFFTEFRTEESGDTDGTGNTDIYRTEETGKTEEEAAELMKELGTPKEAARELMANLLDKKIEDHQSYEADGQTRAEQKGSGKHVVWIALLVLFAAPVGAPLLVALAAVVLALVVCALAVLLCVVLFAAAMVILGGKIIARGILAVPFSMGGFAMITGSGLFAIGAGILGVLLCVYLCKWSCVLIAKLVRRITDRKRG